MKGLTQEVRGLAEKIEKLCMYNNISEELQKLSASVSKIHEHLIPKISRRDYQKEYYKKRTKQNGTKIKNPSHGAFANKDNRLPFAKWANAGLKSARPSQFIEWLAYQWNRNSYQHPPVTRSGGYYNVFVSFDGTGMKPLRNKHTDVDMFGKLRRFTTLSLEACRDAKMWNFGYCVVWPVFQIMREDPSWEGVESRFKTYVGLLCGAFAEIKLKDIVFDLNLEPKQLEKVLRLALPFLLSGRDAIKRGLLTKTEPMLDAPKVPLP